MAGKKATKEQFAAFVSFLEQNETLRFGKGDQQVKAHAFQDLVKILNSVGGPQKDVTEWKKTVTEWKYNARKKRRANKKMTDDEMRLLKLVGEAATLGMAEVQELGAIIPPIEADNETELLNQEVIAAEHELGIIIETGEHAPPEEVEQLPEEVEEWENVEEPEVQPGASMSGGKKQTPLPKKMGRAKKDSLVNIWKEYIEVNNQGLTAVASGLHAIASGLQEIAAALKK